MISRTLDLDAAIATAAGAIDEETILDALRVLTSKPSAHGRERELAVEVSAWGKRAYPQLAWEIDAIDASSASLFAHSTSVSGGDELAIYGHLDTSLTGDLATDAAITGMTADPPELAIDRAAGTVRGFGVGVAKAPSAAGMVAFTRAATALRSLGVPHRMTLLLAAGGTHRASPSSERATFGSGVAHALARSWRPTAVLNVKGGPPGILLEEPVAAYLRVRLRRPFAAALARAQVAPDGGLARHVGAVVDSIEAWRTRYLAAHPPAGQLAPEIAIGAIASGSPDKPDLLPGVLDLFVYAVLPRDEDPDRVARDLAAALASRVGALPGSPTLEVDVYASGPGGAADPESRIARLAASVWPVRERVRAWTGATDGGVFLSARIPTVRIGPRVTRDANDPRIEIVGLAELVAAARAYVEIALRFFAGGPR